MTKPPAMPVDPNQCDHCGAQPANALQQQPAEVSDAEINRIACKAGFSLLAVEIHGRAFVRFARAILALRPAQQATPEPRSLREAREDAQRARMMARSAGRTPSAATADFDLPAHNDDTQQATRVPCKPCDGMGYVDGVGDACATCNGQGATPEPVHVEVVGEIVTTEDGNDVRWSVEGGVAAIPEGMVLLIADRQITDDTGSGEVYTHPAQAAQPVPMMESVQRNAARWDFAMDWSNSEFAVCRRVGATGTCWEPIKTGARVDAAMFAAAQAKGGEA